MKRKLTAGQTSVSLPIFIQDTSSTTGGGLSGLTSGTSGLVAEYRRRGQSSWTAITLTSKTLGTWTSGGIVADGALAGAYELDLPDAVCASGARWVAVRLRGAANMLPCLIEIELDAVDYQVDALGAVKPTTAGRTLTVDTSGNVVLQDGSLTATKIATDAITAAKIASDAVAEIQAGLSTLDAASVRTALGLASANIDTQLAGINAKTTNLPADPADASDIASSFSTVNSTLATIAGYLDTEIAAIKAKTDNLPASPASETTLSALSGKLAGITLLKNWLALIMGKAADTTTRAEVNATTAGATFNETTDSLEAIRDRGDAAWTTGSGGGGSGDWTDNEKTAIRSILGIPSSGTTPADPTTGILDTIRDQVVANGTALAGTPISANSRVASGGTITAYIGDDFKVRSDTELSLSVSDVGGALYTKWNAIGEENLYFGASREGADVGAITGTVAAITSVGSGASQTCKLTVEITNCGSGLKPGTYDYQIEQRQTQGSDTDSFIEVAGSLILKRNSVA